MARNNGLALLEVLWTRIRSRFGLPHVIFGEDLEFEQMTPLLFAKPVPGWGWKFLPFECDAATLSPSSTSWEPSLITETQAAALLLLGQREEIDIDRDVDFEQTFENAQMAKQDVLDSLLATDLVFLDSDRKLRHLTYARQHRSPVRWPNCRGRERQDRLDGWSGNNGPGSASLSPAHKDLRQPSWLPPPSVETWLRNQVSE